MHAAGGEMLEMQVGMRMPARGKIPCTHRVQLERRVGQPRAVETSFKRTCGLSLFLPGAEGSWNSRAKSSPPSRRRSRRSTSSRTTTNTRRLGPLLAASSASSAALLLRPRLVPALAPLPLPAACSGTTCGPPSHAGCQHKKTAGKEALRPQHKVTRRLPSSCAPCRQRRLPRAAPQTAAPGWTPVPRTPPPCPPPRRRRWARALRTLTSSPARCRCHYRPQLRG